VIFSAIHEATRLQEEKIKLEKERLEEKYRFDEASNLEKIGLKILPILVNNPGFEQPKDQKVSEEEEQANNEGSDNNIHPEISGVRRAVLQNVVRRLYQVTRNIDERGKVLKENANQLATNDNLSNGKLSIFFVVIDANANKPKEIMM